MSKAKDIFDTITTGILGAFVIAIFALGVSMNGLNGFMAAFALMGAPFVLGRRVMLWQLNREIERLKQEKL